MEKKLKEDLIGDDLNRERISVKILEGLVWDMKMLQDLDNQRNLEYQNTPGGKEK